MKDENQQFEQLPDEFISVMRQTQQSPIAVPTAVDDAMLEAGRKALRQRSSSSRRWPLAVAAMLVLSLGIAGTYLASVINNDEEPYYARSYDMAPDEMHESRKYQPKQSPRYAGEKPTILHAFELARMQKAGQDIHLSWDVTGDGLVDQMDIDFLANRAVQMEGNDRG